MRHQEIVNLDDCPTVTEYNSGSTEAMAVPINGHHADSLTTGDRMGLITSKLQEVLNPEIIEDIVVKKEQPLVVYWG